MLWHRHTFTLVARTYAPPSRGLTEASHDLVERAIFGCTSFLWKCGDPRKGEGVTVSFTQRNAAGCLLAALSLVVLLPLSLFFYAWAAEVNWNWFAVPLGAPRVTLPQAYGLSLVLSSFTGDRDSKGAGGTGPVEVFILAALSIVGRFAFLVGVGWLVHTYLVRGPS